MIAKQATDAFDLLTPHWRELLPPITAIIVNERFDRIADLRPMIDARFSNWGDHEWEQVYAFSPKYSLNEAEVWLRPYYSFDSFAREVYCLLAQIVWTTTPDIRAEVAAATHKSFHTANAALLYFSVSFGRFFLNRKLLRERNLAAWFLMERLDDLVETKQLQRLQVT
ncbi:MAG TPA: hypothetical protein VMA75_03375 [Candidatus Paceibacterota bacterium]|nr:hypothetical protein [Candidatus Paceibacterota bacterium]